MRSFNGKRLSHAYITNGEAVNTIARTVVCSDRTETGPCNICKHCSKSSRNLHPDITTVNKLPNKRYFTIDLIRNLKFDVVVTPNEAQKKAYILNEAHLMNADAQNAFLKILEEPPPHVVFILNTDYSVKLLPTILSRCIQVKADTPSEINSKSIAVLPDKSREHDEDDFDLPIVTTAFFNAIKNGNPAIIEFMFSLDKLSKEQFIDFITSARYEVVKILGSAASYGSQKNIKAIALADKLLIKAHDFLDQNVNVGHISGYICANLIETIEN